MSCHSYRMGVTSLLDTLRWHSNCATGPLFTLPSNLCYHHRKDICCAVLFPLRKESCKEDWNLNVNPASLQRQGFAEEEQCT